MADKKHVYAIQLSDFRPSAVLPQAIGTIWGYALQDAVVCENYELKRVFWENESADEVIREISDPDVLMCSCYVWNWDRTLQIINAVKEKYPACVVIIGGPEPKYTQEWIQQHPNIDILVPFYGEVVFRNILKSIEEKKNWKNIEGTITRDFFSKISIRPQIDQIPSPYLSGFFAQLMSNKRECTKTVRCVFESNRGCPFSCTFCDVGAKEYSKIDAFEFDRCVQELEWITQNKIGVVDVADANFGILPRDEDLVDKLVEFKKKYQWHGSFLPTWSKNKHSRILSIAKKIITNDLDSIFGLSLQSLNEESLSLVKRRNAFSLEQLSDIVEDMNRSSVSVYTEIIFPLPGDTIENFFLGIAKMLNMKKVFDKFQVNQLSVYSNAEVSERNYSENHGLQWSEIRGTTRHYYGKNMKDKVVVATSRLSREDVFECLFFAKQFLIPLYFYGIIRGLVDNLHEKNLTTRDKFIFDLYEKMSCLESFKKFKKERRDHYFKAIESTSHFGSALTEDQMEFFPEFAYAHLWYLNNGIFDFLEKTYPDYRELVNFDRHSLWIGKSIQSEVRFDDHLPGIWTFSDNRDMERSRYLREVFISGRFDRRWQVEQRNRRAQA